MKNQFCDSTANGTDEREARSKFWIAAYTRPRSERKAASDLAKGTAITPEIETYCPTQTLIKQWSDRKKKIETVVIPMIVFAHVNDEEIKTVEQNPLIVRVLRYPGCSEPANIPDSQIAQLKFMLNGADSPVEFCTQTFKANDWVKVIRGNLKGLIGQIVRVGHDKLNLYISIDILGGAMCTIDSSDIEIIDNKLN